MKRIIGIALLLIVTLMISLFAFTACGNNGEKQVPVYQGMSITKSNSALSLTSASYRSGGIMLLSANNGNHSDNGNHNGHYKGDHTGRNETIDEENPYPDNDATENIEEEIKSSLNVIGSPDEIYYATPNEDIYINIHIDNPDSFEIMSFTLNGKKYSSYMFEEGSDMETIVLKYNVGDAAGIVEYTIDAIKYIDGTEIKDVIIEGNKTVMAGVKTENQVVANVSNVDIDTNALAFNANIKDNNNLIDFSEGTLKAVIYDGFEIVAEKDLVIGENSVEFKNLKTNTLYQYAVVGYYDDLSGDGFKMNVLYKDAFYTDSVVLFDNITIGQENVSFSFLWHEEHAGKAISALKIYQNDRLLANLDVNATSVQTLLSNNTYKLVAEYPNGENTESIYIVFTMLAKATPEISVVNPTKTQTSVGFEINETDIDNVGTVTKIELVHANGTVVADSLDQRAFENLLSNNAYTVKVTYVYNLNDGEGEYTVTKNLAITTDAKTAPSFTVKNENITTESINAEYDINDVDHILSYYKVELYKGDALVSENTAKEIAFEGLKYYNDYKVRFTYKYNLNDGNGEKTVTYDYTFKTLPYIDVTECSIANTSAVSEGDTIFMSVKLDNPLGMTIESVVINGETYNVTGASTKDKIFVEIVYNDQFVGGDTHLKIDRVNAKIDSTTLSVEPKSELSDNVFINGKLEVLKIEFVNEAFEPIDWAFSSDTVYVLVTLNNPTGYTIDSVNTSITGLTKIDNNRWYYATTLSTGWNRATVDNFSYRNEYIYKTISYSNIEALCYEVVSEEIKYISTPEDLKNMSDGYYYELTKDIDLSGLEWLGAEFNGVFDGKEYSIKNMSFVGTIKNTNAYLGLFSTGQGVIKNVNIKEATIIAEVAADDNNQYDAFCGGIIARTTSQITIKSCFVDAFSTLNVSNMVGDVSVGGMIGKTTADVVIFQSANYATINVKALNNKYSKSYAGGIIGYAHSCSVKISNSGNIGTISSSGTYIAYAGGIVGYIGNTGTNILIINYINIGDIISSFNNSNENSPFRCASGGVIGCSYGATTIKSGVTLGAIQSEMHQSSIIGFWEDVGATLDISYCTALNQEDGDCNVTICTIEQLDSQKFYTETLGWNEDIWDFTELDFENGKYPKLKR